MPKAKKQVLKVGLNRYTLRSKGHKHVLYYNNDFLYAYCSCGDCGNCGNCYDAPYIEPTVLAGAIYHMREGLCVEKPNTRFTTIKGVELDW